MRQMFDVKPVKKSGDLDLEKIENVERILRLNQGENTDAIKYPPEENVSEDEILKSLHRELFEAREQLARDKFFENFSADYGRKVAPKASAPILEKNKLEKRDFIVANPIPFHKKSGLIDYFSSGKHFAYVSILIFLIIVSAAFLVKGLETKNLAMANGEAAYAKLNLAKEEITKKNYQGSALNFNDAYQKFEEISVNMDSLGNILPETGRFIPFLSKLTTGKYLTEAGKDISKIGVLASELLEGVGQIKNPLNSDQPASFLDIFQVSSVKLREIISAIDSLEKNLEKINLDDIPEEKREEFVKLKSQLPEIKGFASGFIDDSKIITDVLGGNGPRKYLFLFENNNEMRPTGGFIGSYGILDIFDGRIRNFFVDGIFNPDGQLREKVVPPAPIQKISAAWSLHDSNWFPDFPASAEKARWFYEKTGGPTVDGVIAMTPVVLQRLLEVTGPIEMPEYGVTIDSDNFMEKVQEEVEVNYDKELNQPKKILSDLAPKILDKIFNANNFSDMAKTMSILSESLDEKQILIYANNLEIEKKLAEKGWSGEVLDTERDYLSVINTNINGYKTDGVIEEKIEHTAEIQPDGSIIDEVVITRHHNGGNSDYEWFNKVNADYMRVYVPKGSRLISAEGHTREFNSAPLDYDSLGFRKDPQVEMEEQSIQIDEESGTRIYDDFGKTVFANWVYVSPQETATIRYRYVLPFKINVDTEENLVDAYTLLAQKQSGSIGSDFSSEIRFSGKYKLLWKYPENIFSGSETNGESIKFSDKLNVDRYIGFALSSIDSK